MYLAPAAEEGASLPVAVLPALGKGGYRSNGDTVGSGGREGER